MKKVKKLQNRARFEKLLEYSKSYAPLKFAKAQGSNNFSRDQALRLVFAFGFYATSLVLGLYLSFLLTATSGLPTVYLLFVAVVALNAWFSEIRVAIATIISLLVAIRLFYNTPVDTTSSLPFLLFIVVSLLVSFFIEQAKKTTKVAQFRKREQDYAQTLLNLNEKYNRAQSEIRARDEFLSIASHELKTPLTSMLLQLHQMLHNIRTVSLAKFSIGELMKVLENAERQIKKLAKMINDLLNVSLITTGRLDLDFEKVDLAQTVKEILRSNAEILKRGHYTVKLEAKQQVMGNWDKLRVEQVVTNLLTNAIEYGEGKPIEIKVFNTGKTAKFLITDRGIGISPDKQKILFEKFARGVSQQDYQKGLGVGLYIASQIVKAHKGAIKVQSKPKKGSTFIVELPLKT